MKKAAPSGVALLFWKRGNKKRHPVRLRTKMPKNAGYKKKTRFQATLLHNPHRVSNKINRQSISCALPERPCSTDVLYYRKKSVWMQCEKFINFL
ncbi:hypothetical protein [Butyricicoccus pullicaecorum]|uniref:hypothetical protein n=1 Tax=Butyricicoccus pullicaecorum TaxID=501571 RepID=UPI0011787C9C|nr:hypothetical protein [Butyricicoccus pullicaecorum]